MKAVFVFGSNREGRHGNGAALEAIEALDAYYAVYGQAEGLQGNSYAIVTKELRADRPPVSLEEVAFGVSRFISFARVNHGVLFLVTQVGCGLAEFSAKQIAPLFMGAPCNVVLPESWVMEI